MSPFVYTEIVLNLLRLSSRTYQGNRGLLGNLLNIEDVYTRCCDERLIKGSGKKMCTRKTSLSNNVTNIEHELDISYIDVYDCKSKKFIKRFSVFRIIKKKKKHILKSRSPIFKRFKIPCIASMSSEGSRVY